MNPFDIRHPDLGGMEQPPEYPQDYATQEWWDARREYEEQQAQKRADRADLMWGWE